MNVTVWTCFAQDENGAPVIISVTGDAAEKNRWLNSQPRNSYIEPSKQKRFALAWDVEVVLEDLKESVVNDEVIKYKEYPLRPEFSKPTDETVTLETFDDRRIDQIIQRTKGYANPSYRVPTKESVYDPAHRPGRTFNDLRRRLGYPELGTYKPGKGGPGTNRADPS